MLESVSLLGSSSGRNAGDAALISGIMAAVDEACGTQLLYEIPTIRPKFVAQTYHNRVRPVSMLPWNLSVKMLGLPTYNSVMRTDLSLVFDAILFDRAPYNPLFNFLSTLYLLLPLAKKKGKKMAFYNVGAGPVDSPRGRDMLRRLSEVMDFMAVRDQDSWDLLVDLGVSTDRMILGADAALNVPACDPTHASAIIRKLGLEPEQEILGVNINTYIDTWSRPKRAPMGQEAFLDAYAQALDAVAAETKAPLLFVCTQHDDIEITAALRARLQVKVPMATITNLEYSHFDIKGVLGRIALLSGMRLHAMILASSERTPIAGLAYQPKCEYYFKTLGLLDHNLGFTDFNPQRLTQHILDAWQARRAIRQKLEQRIPVLQQEAFKAAHLVAAWHKGTDLDQLIARYKAGAQATAINS